MKKRLISLLLTVVMLLSLVVVPANAALVSGTGTLTITPNVTSVPGSDSVPIEVIYTIKVTPPTEGPVGEFHFNLKAPDGMTLAVAEGEQGKEGYWVNPDLNYHKTYNKNGIFETFEYTPASKYFQASGTSASRNMTTEAEIMTIKATIAAGKVGNFTLTAENVGINKDGTDSYSVDVKTTPVTITKAPITSVSATVSQPVKGYPLDTSVNVYGATTYDATVMWKANGMNVTGDAQADTVYTALITLKAKEGETFATTLNNTTTRGYTIQMLNSTELLLTKEFDRIPVKDATGITIDNTTLTVAVPTAEPDTEQKAELPLTAKVNYDDGTDETVDVSWSFVTNSQPECVKIEAGSKLTVTNKATDGTVEVKAAYNGMTANATVTITKEPAKETEIVLTAPSSTIIDVPTGSGVKNNSGKCTAKVYDQYGNPITSAGVTYVSDPATMPTGVTFASTTGEFFVDNTAQNGTVKVIAKYGTVTSNPVAFTIKRADGTVNSVTLSGSDPTLTVPEANGPKNPKSKSVTNTYTATVKDQFGVTMPGESVSWSVSGNAGVEINSSTGELTISSNATADSVTITATCKDKSDSKTVSVTRTTPAAKWVKITGQNDSPANTQFVIPAATGTISETSNSYEATVYDQYGKDHNENVDWSLYPSSVAGVTKEVSTTNSNVVTIKVDSNASEGKFDIIATSSSSPAVNGKINLTLTNKTPASVTTAPKAVENLKYTGDEQALVTEGAASGGTMRYSLDNGANWSTAVPTGKNADTYTVQYKVVGDSDHTDYTPTSNTVSVSIGQKEVTVSSGITAENKEYNGSDTATVNASGATFTGKADGDNLTITATGTFANADVGDGKTVTLTLGALGGTSVANYTLATNGNQTTTTADITRRDLTVKPDANLRKKFGAEDPTLNFLPTGAVDEQNPDFTGALSRAEGEAVGQYDITLGDLALKDNGAFKASNYTLKMDSHAEKFEITKADALTLKDITVSQKYTVTTEQSKDIGRAGMPEKAGTLTYAKGTESKTGSVKVDSWSVDSTTGKVSYKLSNGAADDTVTLPVIIKSTNYADATVYVKITLTKPSYSGGGGSYTPSYTVSVDKTENGTITISPKSASKGDTVTITVKPDKGYELDTLKVLDKDGDKVKLTEKNGKYTFKMPSGKVTVKGSFVEEAPVQIFKDVPVDAYYYEAVKWAAEKGITGGVGNGLFGPNDPCTRAQIVTFLWRAAGSPDPKNMSSFADVPADAFYAKAVAWAVENGITGGTGDGKFSPDATCTRAQSVTFLYRAAGSPKVSSSAEFGDVATNTYYADAVAWAAKNGITGGIGGGLFGSNNDCTRAQIVTFLYRCVK